MSVSYVKEAKETLRAQCEFDSKLVKQGDVVIPLEIRDKENDTVFTAKITFLYQEKEHIKRRQVICILAAELGR